MIQMGENILEKVIISKLDLIEFFDLFDNGKANYYRLRKTIFTDDLFEFMGINPDDDTQVEAQYTKRRFFTPKQSLKIKQFYKEVFESKNT